MELTAIMSQILANCILHHSCALVEIPASVLAHLLSCVCGPDGQGALWEVLPGLCYQPAAVQAMGLILWLSPGRKLNLKPHLLLNIAPSPFLPDQEA